MFDENLDFTLDPNEIDSNQDTNQVTSEKKEINEINEKEFLKANKKRNKKSLISLDTLERERVSQRSQRIL